MGKMNGKGRLNGGRQGPYRDRNESFGWFNKSLWKWWWLLLQFFVQLLTLITIFLTPRLSFAYSNGAKYFVHLSLIWNSRGRVFFFVFSFLSVRLDFGLVYYDSHWFVCARLNCTRNVFIDTFIAWLLVFFNFDSSRFFFSHFSRIFCCRCIVICILISFSIYSALPYIWTYYDGDWIKRWNWNCIKRVIYSSKWLNKVRT